MNKLQQGVIKKSTLTDDEITAIEQLTTICNAYEHLHMRFNREMQRTRPGNTIDDFLYYDNGILVGYLMVYNFGTKEKECTGMVHPDYRRKDIFSQLLDTAKSECASRGVQTLILIFDHHSVTAQAFVH